MSHLYPDGLFQAEHRRPAASGTEWSAFARAERYRVETDALLPGAGVAIPDDLWDVETGIGFRRWLRGRRR